MHRPSARRPIGPVRAAPSAQCAPPHRPSRAAASDPVRAAPAVTRWSVALSAAAGRGYHSNMSSNVEIAVVSVEDAATDGAASKNGAASQNGAATKNGVASNEGVAADAGHG